MNLIPGFMKGHSEAHREAEAPVTPPTYSRFARPWKPKPLGTAQAEERSSCSRHVSREQFEECRQVASDAPCSDGAVRIVCISDTHGKHRKMAPLPAGDVLIISGDLTNVGEPKVILDLADWLDEQSFLVKIVIAGNHDVTLHDEYYFTKGRQRFNLPKVDPADLRRRLRQSCCYLEDEGVTIFPLKDGSGGIRVWGTPWQPSFCDWAFNAERGEELRRKWLAIPTETDVLVVHGPPLSRGDRCADGRRVGCADLLQQIQQRVRPQLLVCGHIHEDHGVSSDATTMYVNASTCTLQYKATQPAIVVDLIPRENFDKNNDGALK